ncbi:MAG: hypothetical protein MUD01_10305, partial [Chloroflexaceae bacterium]|nr:hypothetical protein [Chloroflexaceae bacterium]
SSPDSQHTQSPLATRHSPLVTRNSSLVTRHSSLVTRHSSLVTRLAGVFYLLNLMAWPGMPQWPEGLSGWAVLEAVARGLLGDTTPADDLLWAALAELDGREPGTPLGTACMGDLPMLTNEGKTEPLPARVQAAMTPVVAAWLTNGLPGIRALLAQLLNAADTAAIESLLWAHGRLLVGPTHVEVVMPLDAIDLRARRVGLDRDPGWLPQVGRVVLFHFV